MQVGVKAAIQNPEGKLLVMLRSKEKYPEMPLRWDIPGGRINPGSPLLENLSREVLEETGLKLQGEPVLVAAQDILRVPGRHVVRLTYSANAEGKPVLSDEHTEHKWVTLAELESLEGLDIYFKEILHLLG